MRKEVSIRLKTIKLFVYLSVFSSVLLVGCSYPSNHQLLNEAFGLVEEYPDSIADLLENKIIQTSLNDRDKADYWYLLTLTHLLQGRSLVNDSLIHYSVQYYREQNNLHHLFNACRFATWQINWGSKDKEQQECLLQEAVSVAETKNDTTFLSVGYRQLANFYADEKCYRKAIGACQKLTSFSEQSKASAWYIMGLIYGRMGIQDSSLYFLSEAASLSDAIKSPDAIHYMRNYADCLAAEDPKQALSYLEKIQNNYPVASWNLTYAMAYKQFGQKDSAEYYFAKAERDKSSEDLWNATWQVYMKAIRTVWQAGDKLPYNLRELTYYCDSVSQVTLYSLQNEKELSFARNKLLQDNLKVETNRQQILIVLFVVLFVFTVVTGIVYLSFRNRRDSLLETEEKLETLQRLLQEATAVANLPVISDGTIFRKILLQQLGTIRLMATSPTEQNKELLQQMARIANGDVPTDALLIWTDLYPVIDAVYDGFYSHLIRLADNRLSEKEFQLCCLLRAEFSTKEISVVMQQSVRTIYQRKTTIRHALSMNEKDDIIAYIDRAIAPK